MRYAIIPAVMLAFTGLAIGQGKKTAAEPIKVIAIQRSEPVSYEKEIEPILAEKCQFCHSGPVKEGKFDMGSFETLVKGGKSGPALVSGKSAESLLVKLGGRIMKPIMPPKSEEPLTPQELALLKLWIDQGAKATGGKREKSKVILSALPAIVHQVHAIAVSPDKSAVAAGRANRIDIYDAGSGTHIRALVNPELTGADKSFPQAAHAAVVESMTYSPNGKFLASGSFQEVQIWDAQLGLPRKKLTGFADRVVAMAFSPNGKILATGGGAPTEDGEIKLFDTATGNQLLEIKNGHSDTVYGVCFSPDNTKIATCGADKFVKVFEVATGKFIKAFEGHTHHVLDIGWKADGKVLASCGADNVIKVWDYEKGEQVRTFGNSGKQITRLLFKGSSSEILTCSGDQNVRFWNVDNGGGGMAFGGSSDFLYAIGVSPDGKVVAAGGEEGIVRLYNGTNGQLVKALLPPGTEVPAVKR